MTFTEAELRVLRVSDGAKPDKNHDDTHFRDWHGHFRKAHRLGGRQRTPMTDKQIATALEFLRRGWTRKQVQAYLKMGRLRFDRHIPKEIK